MNAACIVWPSVVAWLSAVFALCSVPGRELDRLLKIGVLLGERMLTAGVAPDELGDRGLVVTELAGDLGEVAHQAS